MLDEKDMTVTESSGAVRDEEAHVRAEYVERVADAITAGDGVTLRELAGELHEADTGDLIEALDRGSAAPPGRDARARLRFLRADRGRRHGARGNPRRAARRNRRRRRPRTRFRRRGHILEDLPKEEQAEILEQIPAAERVALKRSLDYPEDSAGRRMQTEFIAVGRDWTVGQTIDHMRETPICRTGSTKSMSSMPSASCSARSTLDRLLRTKRPVPIAELMNDERRRVRATDDQEEVARMFERYNLVAAPVVDDDERLVGVLTVDDIVDVIEEEAEEDIKALGGVRGEEELSDSVWTIARGRFNWLLVNLATAFLASSVLGLFEGELEKMVALAVLAPIVASQGGNAATQTMTVAVRALATRELSDANAWRDHPARAAGRRCSTGSPSPSSPASRRRLVQGARPWHRHRARHDLQSGGGGARRHPDPARA